MNTPLFQFEELDSTSNQLSKLAAEIPDLPECTVVATQFQTAGRGQIGNHWESEQGKNLLFSLLLYPTFLPIPEQFLLSQAISLGIADFLTQSIGLTDIRIKWPNDIYWNNSKICGFLVENTLMGAEITHSIAGIGININQEKFHSDAPNPISVFQITGKIFDLSALLPQVVESIHKRYNRLSEGKYEPLRADYYKLLYHNEGYHKYSDEKGDFTARIHSIAPNGILTLETLDGELRHYAFKEVHQYVE